MTTRSKPKTKKEIVFTIEYRADPRDINIQEVLDKMQETGAATILDVWVNEVPEDNA